MKRPATEIPAPSVRRWATRPTGGPPTIWPSASAWDWIEKTVARLAEVVADTSQTETSGSTDSRRIITVR